MLFLLMRRTNNDLFLFALTTALMFALGYLVGRLHGGAQAFFFSRKTTS